MMLQFGVTEARADGLKNRLVLIVEEGDTIFLVPPPLQEPIGTSGAISLVRLGPVGTFETGLLSGESLAPVLIEVITTGSAIAGPVGGTFTIGIGAIEDEVPTNLGALPIARTGQFLFEFD